MSIRIKINGNEVKAKEVTTILQAAQINDIYIPRLCYHPSLGSSHGIKPVDIIYRDEKVNQNDGSGPKDGFSGCKLCLVEIEGLEGFFTSCDTLIEEGMVIYSENERIKKERKENLAEILRDHPHACLQCAQREGCSRTQCSTNVPEDERCCPLLGHCELQKVAEYIGVREDLSKYVFKNLSKHENEPLFNRDYNLCISCLRCVRACRDLRGVETLGFVYQDGKVIVGPTKSSIYSESDCKFCGACVEVCPTGALTDRDLPRGERQEVLVPCIANCPVGIDIPRYIRLINEGNYTGALAVIMERTPFPGILGMVCFHPCEEKCRRGELNQPMAICALKRFAVENDGSWKINVKEKTGKKVAIVGSGPAGLSAAYYLARLGHSVTVFEAEMEIGGMLRYAIPEYRLRIDVLKKDLSILNELNVEFKINTTIGKDITLSKIRNDFNAIFIATGATLSKKIPIEGCEIENIKWGLDFLKDVKKKKVTSISGKVVVIGGGNVAMDVARTAIRLGASEVQLACLESDTEMPAHDWEIEEAKEEGIVMNTSCGPEKILGEDKVTGIELVTCTSVFDSLGNFSPKFDKDSTTTLEADSIILAIGQTSDTSFLEGSGIGIKRDTISVDEEMKTNSPDVFAGGEIARGPASVVEAIADGAMAASGIDKYLGGDGNIYLEISESKKQDPWIGKTEGFSNMKRVEVPKNMANERRNNFDMVELGYDEEQAKYEAGRCLRCDLRLMILPVKLPPDKWLELNEENVAKVPSIEGVFQLLDENKKIIVIKGTQDIHADILEKLNSETNAKYFGFEPDKMYSKRESELIQQFLQQFGKMPEGDGAGDDIDDLF